MEEGGGRGVDAIHLEPPLYWISPRADQACKKDISLALKQKKTIMMIKKTCSTCVGAAARVGGGRVCFVFLFFL